jgi:hypothetical protein
MKFHRNVRGSVWELQFSGLVWHEIILLYHYMLIFETKSIVSAYIPVYSLQDSFLKCVVIYQQRTEFHALT